MNTLSSVSLIQFCRARSVMGTQHLATVADAGSNPVGSTLPFMEVMVLWERMRGCAPDKGNLTVARIRVILSWSRGAVYPNFEGLDQPGPFRIFAALARSTALSIPRIALM